jgi:hypothetical protein
MLRAEQENKKEPFHGEGPQIHDMKTSHRIKMMSTTQLSKFGI